MKNKRKTSVVAGLAVAAALALPAMGQTIPAISGTVVGPPTDSGEVDLTPSGTQAIALVGDVGGTAVISDYFEQPTGTGVFKPFLSLDANGQSSTGNNSIEQAYNTDGFAALYLDEHRPQWNNLLTYGELADVQYMGSTYHAFVLDANEPGGNKSLISVDNIRIYTSATDNTAAVGDDMTKLGGLGDLRWAMNDPVDGSVEGFNIDKWVKLDARQENVEQGSTNSNGGSGKGDMIVLVPKTAFAGANPDDLVFMYNLNGVHYAIDDKNNAAESGFEEWRALVGPTSVPDGGSTLILLGLTFAGLAVMRRKQT